MWSKSFHFLQISGIRPTFSTFLRFGWGGRFVKFFMFRIKILLFITNIAMHCISIAFLHIIMHFLGFYAWLCCVIVLEWLFALWKLLNTHDTCSCISCIALSLFLCTHVSFVVLLCFLWHPKDDVPVHNPISPSIESSSIPSAIWFYDSKCPKEFEEKFSLRQPQIKL